MEGHLLSFLSRAPRRPVARPSLPLSAIDEHIALLHAHAIEPSTRRNYSTGARDYILFCSIHGLPLDPTPLTIARYVAYTSLRIASAPKYLSGARHFLRDVFPEFDTARKHALVQTTIRGSRKHRADPIRRKAPLRLSHLSIFQALAHRSSDYDDFLFLTLLTAAFFACHRVGELLAPNDISLWDWRKLIRRASFSSDHDHACYHLPYNKTDPFYQGTDIRLLRATASNGIDPVAILRDYVARRDRRHGARTPLFLRADGSRPTRSWFERKLFDVLPRAHYGGHSARAGGATYFASLGLSEDVIRALGRWSSKSWSIYIRDHPTVRAEVQLSAIRRSAIPSAPSPSTSTIPHTHHQ